MAALGVAETKMGRVDHKTAKHMLVADKTPGTSDIVAQAKTGDYGLTLTEMAPFGVVGSITPSTNPSETVICNSIGMIAAGNGVVFNPHPGAIATSNYAIDLVNRASKMAGGPEVLVASVVAIPLAYMYIHRWLQEYPLRIDNTPYIYLGAVAVVLVIVLAVIAFHAYNLMRTNPARVLKKE